MMRWEIHTFCERSWVFEYHFLSWKKIDILNYEFLLQYQRMMNYLILVRFYIEHFCLYACTYICTIYGRMKATFMSNLKLYNQKSYIKYHKYIK